MAQRNIHGFWNVRLEGRILYTETIGLTNAEAAIGFLEDVKKHVLSSPESDSVPWVALNDFKRFEGYSSDKEAVEAADTLGDWAKQHNCVASVCVVTNAMQEFMIKNSYSEDPAGFIIYFTDYDKAHQFCLDKLDD